MTKTQLLKMFLVILGVLIVSASGYSAWKINRDIERMIVNIVNQPIKLKCGANQFDWKEYVDETGIKFKYPNIFYIFRKENASVIFKPKFLNEHIGTFYIAFRKKEYNEIVNISNLPQEYVMDMGISNKKIILIDGIESLQVTLGNSSFNFEPNNPPLYLENIIIPYKKIIYEFGIEVSLDPTDESSINSARNYYKLYQEMISNIDIPD
jgi:hypothetical protein